MLRKMLIIFTLVNLLALVGGCMAPAPPKPGKEIVRVSVQPVYSLHIMSQKYSPLFRYLGSETGYDIRVVSAMSYDNYLPTLEANQVHIGIQNPLAYVTLVKTRGAHPLAKMAQPDGSTSYRGVIIARQGGGIDAIEDLRGKTVATASRRAVGGFLAQAIACRQHGIDVDQDLNLSLVDTQDAVIDAVYQGKAEAGFVREDALPLVKERLDLSQLNTIAYTDYYPTWCVAAFANTPAEVGQKIARALLNLDWEKPEHREILAAAGVASFQKAADSDYDIIRTTMEALNIPY